MRIRVKALAALAAAGAMVLSGCGLSDDDNDTADVSAGSVDANALKGAELTIGSKEFDEQTILGQMTLLYLKAAGAKVTDKTGIEGTDAVRQALTSGEIDLYWEYTGTGWLSLLGQDVLPGGTTAQEYYEKVRDMDLQQNQIVWYPPAKLDNAYAIGVSSETADKLGIESLSDLADVSKDKPEEATFCVAQEFVSRPDGFEPMLSFYGIQEDTANRVVLDLDLVYNEIDKGDSCNFGEVFATDGRLKSLDLTVLKDDKEFFPKYNASPTTRKEIADQYPKLEEVLQPLTDKLTTEVMTGLNEKVSVDGQKPEDVAEQFLKDEGFIS